MTGPYDTPDPSTNCSFEIDEEDGPPWDCDRYFPEGAEGGMEADSGDEDEV